MPRRWPDRLDLSTEDRAACRASVRAGSRSFHAASLILPRAYRDPAYALYAFCRIADDAVDEHGGRLETLAELSDRLDRIYAGRPADSAADRGLAAVARAYELPRALPEALLEGLEWDARGQRYDELSDLYAYAARVAGTVGAMMAVIMGARERDTVARACDLGVAMQLTNIARDVGTDARAGRIYLPVAWLVDAGIDPDSFLATPRPSPALAGVVRRLLETAETLYGRADPGIAGLPPGCRPGIGAARRLYAGIGREVARRGHDSVSGRAVVPGRRKLSMVGVACLTSLAGRRAAALPPLPETRFLVDAAALPDAARAIPRPSYGERIAWVAELFARLEEQERLQRQAERP
ncbi:MAG: phytoene/squalene synthase family protein [Azospirillaceae bacterium]